MHDIFIHFSRLLWKCMSGFSFCSYIFFDPLENVWIKTTIHSYIISFKNDYVWTDTWNHSYINHKTSCFVWVKRKSIHTFWPVWNFMYEYVQKSFIHFISFSCLCMNQTKSCSYILCTLGIYVWVNWKLTHTYSRPFFVSALAMLWHSNFLLLLITLYMCNLYNWFLFLDILPHAT